MSLLPLSPDCSGVVFRARKCNECLNRAFPGFCWTCAHCDDYDLCTACYMADKHDTKHAFVRKISDGSPGVNVPPRFGSEKEPAKGT